MHHSKGFIQVIRNLYNNLPKEKQDKTNNTYFREHVFFKDRSGKFVDDIMWNSTLVD